MENRALGDIVDRAARSGRGDPRRNWKRNRLHRRHRDILDVIPVHRGMQSPTRDPVTPDGSS
jgi:hypothetical protein